jgi:hypothetical protein
MVAFVGWDTSGLCAQENVFLPMNASRVRALGMAAAYQAARDDLATISYNPASFSLYNESKKFRLTAFLAPVMPILISRNSTNFYDRAVEKKETVYASVVSFIKAVNITYKNLDFGFLVGEPPFAETALAREKKAFHVNSLYNNHYDAVYLRIKLAEQVAIGASVFLSYYETAGNRRDWGVSASYGITMQPNDYFRFGVSLYSAPTEIKESREFLDEVYNDAIGLGATFFMPWQMILAFDIRNLAVNQDRMGERFLVGLEQSVWSQLAIRTGVQYHPDDNSLTHTIGLGVLNLNALWGRNRQLRHHDFALNYALVRKKIMQVKYHIHAFSLQIRL